MAMESFMKEPNRASLLTIPRSDLNSASPSEALLLQLPLGWKPSDLQHARFVGGADSQQAALVVESKQCSFACYTVETSNAFILVPPSNCGHNNSNNNNKRSKVLESGKTLTTVHARLLKMGGAGASFLELRPKTLRRSELLTALQQGDSLWDPYNNNVTEQGLVPGHTIPELADLLQLSQAQIREGLARIPNAMQRPQSEEYVLVAEEALQECYHAIVAALTEVDEFQNYATGIAIHTLMEEALYRMSPEERFADADHVLLHCLGQLSNDSVATADKKTRVQLDVAKVAVCVASRLLQKESTEWLDEETFCKVWQSELPGTAYQVELDMLRGVAVVKESEISDVAERPGRQLKYLPVDKLPRDPQNCIEQLFQIKQRWLLRELEPYLDRLTDDGTTTISELLLRFTQTETEDRDGISTKVYLEK